MWTKMRNRRHEEGEKFYRKQLQIKKKLPITFDFRFSHAGLVILPQKQNPDDLFLGPRNATVSPPTSAGAQPRRRISLYHDMKFSAVNEEAAAQGENSTLGSILLGMKLDDQLSNPWYFAGKIPMLVLN